MAKNSKNSNPAVSKTNPTASSRSVTKYQISGDTKKSSRSVATKASRVLIDTGKDKRFVKTVAAGRIVDRDTVVNDDDTARHVQRANAHLLRAWNTIHESNTKRRKAS